jgi:voltage-dependent potassium channel beta subunit
MQYRRLGDSGLQVSALSLGSWLTFGKQISDETAEALMVRAYDAGVNFFDNAEIYARGKSEQVMGNILRKLGWRRSSFVVSSKAFFGDGNNLPNETGLSRKHLIEACENALRRLQVEYLDIYFCHRPDPNTPILETVRAMNTLIQQGKILYWGTSEWSAKELLQAFELSEKYGLIPPTTEQPQYNMLVRERFEQEYAPVFEKYKLGSTIWSPLGSGALTGKYKNLTEIPTDTRLAMPGLEWLKESSLDTQKLDKVAQLTRLSDDLGVSLPRLAIAWCLSNPNVSTVILGASKLAQLEENLTALEVLPFITEPVKSKILQILTQ